jgi:nucleoside 2-deoxyribosyltransferase
MKSVAFCGSRRFKPELRKFAKVLQDKDVVCYIPFHHSGQEEWESLSKKYKQFIALGLTHEHFNKIRLADVVYVFNKNGYSGNSTTLEIGYAAALEKPIYGYSDQDDELCRKYLFRGFYSDPKQFLQVLK